MTWLPARRCRAIAGAAGLAALLAACGAVGPDHRTPSPLGTGDSARPLPAIFKEAVPPAAAAMQPARPERAEATDRWWTVFGDAGLDALVAQVDAANPSLAQAEARHRQALAALEQARAARLPTVGANVSRTRAQGRAGTVAVPGGGTVALSSGTIADTLNASLSASWEVDLWGRVRRLVEAGEASAAAATADLEAARLSLKSQLVASYVALRVVEAQRALLEQIAESYQRVLSLTEQRAAAGVASKAEVLQARSQWLAVRAQAVDTGVQRAQLEHAIASLVGKAPAEFSIPAATTLTLALPDVDPQLPAQLLERRPDIAAAERRVAAANAQIGIASAAFFPALTLNAGGGYRGPSLGDLISLPNRFWSFAPALAVTVFDGGARSAAREQALSAHAVTVAAYRQTVLAALQEVEDQLAALRVLEAEHAIQSESERTAVQSAAMILEQYRAGTAAQINVLAAQANELTARRALLAVQGQRLSASVALMKALGGRW